MKPQETLVIITGAQEYWAPTSTQSLRMAEAFAQTGCEVLYLECGGDGRSFREGTSELGELGSEIYRATDRAGFFLGRIDSLPGMRLSFPNAARYLHGRSASRKIKGFLAGRKSGRSPLAVHYGWFFPELLAGEPEIPHVYECLDDHTAALNIRGSQWRRLYVTKIEHKLLSRADLTVFSSPLLAESRKDAARRTEVIPLGVDGEHFAQAPRRDPHEEHGIGRPRIGFLGRVSEREDWELARAAAAASPDWQWVVLGPAEGLRLPQGTPNLHFVGGAAYTELPDWLGNWDAAFVPLADTEFNRAAWPLKFYELLAAGLGIAATPLPATRELEIQTAGLVLPTAGWGARDLVAAAGEALALRERARREGPAFAAKHSWKARAKRILSLLDETAPRA
jgi:glycosyltransferase involved in cell wall biosynthesis